MADNIRDAQGIFGRCQTCMRNMLRNICAFSCSPEQSRFMNVTAEPSNLIEGAQMITAIHVNMAESYINGTFDSCRSVILPSSGRPSMESACGEYASDCTPRRWYQFMSDPAINPEFVPFLIDYRYDAPVEQTLAPEPLPCNLAYDGAFECSCMDCADSCPVGGPTPTADGDDAWPFRVGTLNGVTFCVAIVFGVLGIVAVLFGTMRVQRAAADDEHRRSWQFRVPACFAGVSCVNAGLTGLFGWWGRSCARHPVLTLAVCSWAVAALAYGVQFLVIVTDPVELWASPLSQTRQEKTYFDERFGPFFRTEQVFVKPRWLGELVYESTAGGIGGGGAGLNVTFGPAFNRTFMREVFRLQDAIERLGEEDGEGLERLCFAPVMPLGNPVPADRSKCTVQSAFGYLGNSFDVLEYTDYLARMSECIA